MILANIELPVLIVYIVMAVGFIVMVWGIKNQNTKPNARIIMYLGVVMVLGCVIGRMFISPKKSENARFERNARIFQEAKAEKAAEYISERFQENGATVAFLIDDASNSDSASENYAMLEILKERFKDHGIACADVLVVGEKSVDKKTGAEKVENPTDATIMNKKLNQVYDKVDMVVNLVGLPRSVADLKKITFLTKKNTTTGKNNMLLMCDTGLPFVEQDMLKSGRVCAIVRSSGDESAEFNIRKDSAPKNLSDTFDIFFSFINPGTLSGFISENPNYFVSVSK